jgi:hypothetical protein
MMYNQKMACCLKANGKVLREFKDTVFIPFGSEYSILLKNLNSVRAIANITIDGQEVVPGGLVIDAGREIDIERFVKDLSKGNKFKFIERTAGIEKHRGVKMEDGLIRISFKYEKVQPVNSIFNTFNNTFQHGIRTPFIANDQYTGPFYGSTSQLNSGSSMLSANNISCSTASANVASNSLTRGVVMASGATAQAATTPINDVGITVPGSMSEQKFQTVSNFLTESEEHVMVLRILGETEGGQQVAAPVTVKQKPKCVTCGRVNKATSKFCTDCGTALEIV